MTATDSDLVPRRYQEEIFIRAQKGNIIAALDTGSGKTLISRLLILWVSVQPLSKGKAIIFLVPRVTLVAQQANFLADKTSLRVTQLYGALEMDLTDRKGWKKKFNSYDVFVMTPQIFLNLITHSLWAIDKVSLIVFDECHHARKSHPYNSIMREYFFVDPLDRPKIFGMTASPIWNPKDPQTSLATLEANLDAKVIGVREHVDELKLHAPKPIEIVKEYPYPPERYDYPSPTLHECLSVFEKVLWEALDIPWANIDMRYFSTYYNLGPYCASLFLYLEMQNHITRVRREYRTADDDMDMEGASITPIPNPYSTKVFPEEFLDIEEIVTSYESFFVSPTDPLTLPISVPLEWCTPKLRTLVEILLTYRSETFQAIIFVEQRQVAVCLSRVLQCIPELGGVVRSAYLVGQGVNSEGVSSRSFDAGQGDAVKLFREGKVNILIATSVAEEGLDFPACDLVVRYDPLQHMVGYVQSRGRARNKASTFVIMIQENDIAQLTRYKMLQDVEPELKQTYQQFMDRPEIDEQMDEESDHEDIDPADLAERERFVVPSTGAVLTYDNSVDLLARLCALMPRDAYTPVYKPKYSGTFEALVELPGGLPLPPSDLGYYGPLKRTKKEARRAVAFRAVKRLYELNVFDEFLLPVTDSQDDFDDPYVDVRNVPVMMQVDVVDPWGMGVKMWLHYVFVGGRRVGGLITGTPLPLVDLKHYGTHLRTGPGKQLFFSDEQRHAMKEYTNVGIRHRITGRPFPEPPSLYLVPLTASGTVDFKAVDLLLQYPNGCFNWDMVPGGDVFVANVNESGRIRKLFSIRHDVSPSSKPPPGSREDAFDTYYDFFVNKWTYKKRAADVSRDGPMLETIILPKGFSGAYNINPSRDEDVAEVIIPNGGLIPLKGSQWIPISADIFSAFELLPVLCRRITDLYRIQRARIGLSIPPVREDLLIEALTLPSVTTDFSNQRLETLGDAVLELCATVHLYSKYPTRHEGQLTKLRKLIVSNRSLLARAKSIGLEHFITSEKMSVFKWRYILSNPEDRYGTTAIRRVLREYPRRSLQDCMEALLGASFLTGGISMALQMGTALGLEFGGTEPWSLRVTPPFVTGYISSLFSHLQVELGYNFKSNRILLEAATHNSFASPIDGPSYQRLEFLGDALLDLVVIKYLYDKFPKATSHELAFPRTKAICASALAWLAVRKLGLHKVLLVNNVELSAAIEPYIPLFESTSPMEIVTKGWRYDPPKVLSDVFESVMGAVLIDSGYDYELTAAVVEHAMEDILLQLSPSVAKDPVSELQEWAAASGCTKLSFLKMKKESTAIRYGVAVLVHDIVVAGPIVSTSNGVAKFVAAERALTILQDSTSERNLSCVCSCEKTSDIGSIMSAIALSAAAVDDLLDVVETKEVHDLLVPGGDQWHVEQSAV